MLEMRKLYKLSLFLGYSDHSSNKGVLGNSAQNVINLGRKYLVMLKTNIVSEPVHSSVSENQEHPCHQPQL